MRLTKSFGAAAVVLLAGCNPPAPPAPVDPLAVTPIVEAAPTPEPTPAWMWIETGDLGAIRDRKTLRVLTPRQGDDGFLPRKGFPLDFEREAVAEFAKAAGLGLQFVYVDSRDDLMPWLLEGKGDLIAANFTATPARRETVAFTVPVDQAREQVITRLADAKLAKPADLAGRKVVIRRGSSFWGTMEALKKKHPKIELVAAPETLDTEAILAKVAEGEYDVTVADSNLVEAVFGYRQDLRVAFEVSGERPIAWATRPSSKDLRGALDKWLNRVQLATRRPEIYKEDLPALRRRKVLRVLTRNSAASYFLWKGELLGFDYELARAFAKKEDLRLEIVVAPTREDLLLWLKEGRGDIAAAALTPTEERKTDFAFSRPYNLGSEIVVAKAGTELPADVGDLAGRTFVVRRSSSYWSSLEKLQKTTGISFTVLPAPEDMETEEIIAKVGSGEYDLTVCDGPILDIELTWRTDVAAAFPLGDPVAHGWAVRKEDKKLLAAIDAFVKQEYRGTMYNIAYKKYFKDPRRIRSHAESRADKTGVLSPYDAWIRTYADKYGFDWRLIAAQMYEESRFDPAARSWVGAIGLMQVMPRTASELGLGDVSDPQTGIHAGVKYMGWTRDRFEPELPVQDRAWFALAAYNAGYGHVQDARRLAKERKLDPDRWFGNVEQAMLLLAKPEFARKARFGYCRGQEPVDYVREIRDRYEAYARVAKPGMVDAVAAEKVAAP